MIFLKGAPFSDFIETRLSNYAILEDFFSIRFKPHQISSVWFVFIRLKSYDKLLHWAFKWAGVTNSWLRLKNFWILEFFDQVFQIFSQSKSYSRNVQSVSRTLFSNAKGQSRSDFSMDENYLWEIIQDFFSLIFGRTNSRFRERFHIGCCLK